MSLPELTDQLFKEANKDFRNNAILSTGVDKFYLYSEGYRQAAITLSEQIKSQGFFTDLLVYPLIYLNRQFLELRLKELISGLNYVLNQTNDFPTGHNLRYLWFNFLALINKIGVKEFPDSVYFDSAEKLILEFNSLDPISMTFRYPVDKSGKPTPTLSVSIIDLKNFQETMEKLYAFFETNSIIVSNFKDFTDEYISQMQQQFENDMRSYY